MPVDWQTLSTIGAVALISATGVVWLEARFRGLEKTFYRALASHVREDNERFNAGTSVNSELRLRVQRLEILEQQRGQQ